jgi:membrane-bound metal-dependent hydrolase YbcI (DUF457 family)
VPQSNSLRSGNLILIRKAIYGEIMPFTPFHLGPGLLLGLLALRWLDLPTVLLASVLVDIRTSLVFFGLLSGPLHGPFHTFFGSAFLATVLIAAIVPVRSALDFVLEWLRLQQAPSTKRIIAGAFVGVWLHVILDAILYTDMSPLAPFPGNPLLGQISVTAVYVGCLVAGGFGVVLYVLAASGLVQFFPLPNTSSN